MLHFIRSQPKHEKQSNKPPPSPPDGNGTKKYIFEQRLIQLEISLAQDADELASDKNWRRHIFKSMSNHNITKIEEGARAKSQVVPTLDQTIDHYQKKIDKGKRDMQL